MKKIIFTFLLAAVSNISFAQSPFPKGYTPPKVVNETDSVSMFLGMDVGRNVHVLGFDIDFDSFMYGFLLSASDRDFDTAQATEYLREYFTVRLPARQNAGATEWLDNLMASNPRLVRTESGLVYEILNPGDMNFRATADDDAVQVKYTGMLTDGTVFDSNDDAEFILNRVIPGWTEGMKLVGKGGTIKLYIHPELGYGQRVHGTPIPPNSILIFEVEVLDAPEVL